MKKNIKILKRGKSTLHKYAAAMDLIMKYRFDGKCENFGKRVKYKSEYNPDMSYLTRDEIHQIISYLESRIDNIPENIPVFQIMYLKIVRERTFHVFWSLLQSGMRVSELCSIDFKHDFKGRYLNKITKSYSAKFVIIGRKTKNKRSVYIPYASYKFFLEHPIHADEDPIVYLTVWAIENSFRELHKENEMLPLFTPHTLRRSCGSLMAYLGISEHEASQALGNTVDVYHKYYAKETPRRKDVDEAYMAYIKRKVDVVGNPHIKGKKSGAYVNKKKIKKSKYLSKYDPHKTVKTKKRSKKDKQKVANKD